MARHKQHKDGKSKFDRAVHFLNGKVLERHEVGAGGVWGIVKRGKKHLRIRPQFGLDVVEKRDKRWRKVDRVLTAKELDQWLAAKSAPKNSRRLEAAVRSAA